MNTTSKLIALAVIAAVMIAATTVVATGHQAFASDTRQSGRCGSCQQNQASNGAQLDTTANGGQANVR
jgi:hypothetical protein